MAFDMLSITRRGFLAGTALGMFIVAANDSIAQQASTLASTQDGAGIIWVIGTVQQNGRVTSVDLGDVHGINETVEHPVSVAVFRSRDGHFVPVGSVRVKETTANSLIPETTTGVELRPDDRVVFTRTLSQMGTGSSFQDEFIRRQLVRSANRNGYSTLHLDGDTNALQRFISRQPRWEHTQKHIAGSIRSASVSSQDVREMEPLFTQIMKFQDYQALGVPIEKTVGPAWSSVQRTLTPVQVGPLATTTTVTPTVVTSSTDEETTNAKSSEMDPEMVVVLDKKIASIRRNVEKVLFARSKEERNVVTMLCVALEVTGIVAEKNRDITPPRNERQWFELQLRKTQFPLEADNSPFLDDIATIMRNVRAED